ncbi:MAG: hypothetical protein NTW32_21225 [Chloroflexi bacterium]|nr:hypothetical protein [Chloroflexota bacterium]
MQTKPALKITKKPGMAVQTEVKAGNPSAQPTKPPSWQASEGPTPTRQLQGFPSMY